LLPQKKREKKEEEQKKRKRKKESAVFKGKVGNTKEICFPVKDTSAPYRGFLIYDYYIYAYFYN